MPCSRSSGRTSLMPGLVLTGDEVVSPLRDFEQLRQRTHAVGGRSCGSRFS